MKSGTAVLLGGLGVVGLVGVALATQTHGSTEIPIPQGLGFPSVPNTTSKVKATSGRTYNVSTYWAPGAGKRAEFNVAVRTDLPKTTAPDTWISYTVDATTKVRTMFKAAAANIAQVALMRVDFGLAPATVKPA